MAGVQKVLEVGTTYKIRVSRTDKNGDAKNARLEFAAQTRSEMQGVENARLENGAQKTQGWKMREKTNYACG